MSYAVFVLTKQPPFKPDVSYWLADPSGESVPGTHLESILESILSSSLCSFWVKLAKNNKLVHPPLGLSPARLGNPASATATFTLIPAFNELRDTKEGAHWERVLIVTELFNTVICFRKIIRILKCGFTYIYVRVYKLNSRCRLTFRMDQVVVMSAVTTVSDG